MNTAVIVASGKGTRTGLDFNKNLLKINGLTFIEILVDKFLNTRLFDEIIVTTNEESQSAVQSIVQKYSSVKVILGGEERAESVYAGIAEASNEVIFIHDGARPYLEEAVILNMAKIVEEEKKINCFGLGVSVVDTINVVVDGRLMNVLDRRELMAMQTPQVVRKKKYVEIYNAEEKKRTNFTDETSLFYSAGEEVRIIPGDLKNIKITNKEDVERLSDE